MTIGKLLSVLVAVAAGFVVGAYGFAYLVASRGSADSGSPSIGVVDTTRADVPDAATQIDFWSKRVADQPNAYLDLTLLGQAFARKARETSDIDYYVRAENAVRRALRINPETSRLRRCWPACSSQCTSSARRSRPPGRSSTSPAASRRSRPSVMHTWRSGTMHARDRVRGSHGLGCNTGGLQPACLARGGARRQRAGNPPDGESGETRERFRRLRRESWLVLVPTRRAELQGGPDRRGRGVLPRCAASIRSLPVCPRWCREGAGCTRRPPSGSRALRACDGNRSAARIARCPGRCIRSIGARRTGPQAVRDRRSHREAREPKRQVYNRHLAVFYADHGLPVGLARQLALRELRVRKDVYGDDALGWALARAGRCDEALPLTKRALRLGTQDPLLYFHRGYAEGCAGNRAAMRDWYATGARAEPRSSRFAGRRLRERLWPVHSGSGTYHRRVNRTWVWLVVSPVVAAGVLTGHWLAYRLTATPTDPLHAYLEHAPQVLLILTVAALILAALGTRIECASRPSLPAGRPGDLRRPGAHRAARSRRWSADAPHLARVRRRARSADSRRARGLGARPLVARSCW